MIEIDSLIHRQLEASPMFANNFKNMYSSELREVRFDGFSYTLQMNPARIQSATADITQKPDTNRCFLCSGNLIEGQVAEDYTLAFLIAVNPFPLAENHITIISKLHQPQGIIKIVDSFVKMADDMPDYAVFYNGPKCGASAPFHLHFQALKADALPVYNQIESLKTKAIQRSIYSGALIHKIDDGTRRFVLIEADNAFQAQYYIERVLHEVNRIYNTTEPEVNVGIVLRDGYYTITIFPREKHRPDEYFRSENRILCSPGYADLAGLIPVCLRENFYSITDNDIRSIMRQVCISAERFAALNIS